MTKVASEKFQSSQTNFGFRGSLPRGDGSGIIFLVPAVRGPRPCAWEGAAGLHLGMRSALEDRPFRLSCFTCLTLSAALCSHICPLPRAGQFGSGDSVVGETRSANSPPLGAGARSQFCGSLRSSTQDQCCGGGDKDARELGTLLPLVAPACPPLPEWLGLSSPWQILVLSPGAR